MVVQDRNRKLTILFSSLDAVGHMNACIGLAGPLRDRGHNVVFATPNGWKGKLEALGFKEELYSTLGEESAKDQGFNDVFQAILAKSSELMAMPLEDQVEDFLGPMLQNLVKDTMYMNPQMLKIMQRVQPDIVIADNMFHVPALFDFGPVPYIISVSMNPMLISGQNLPPPFSGYSTIEGDKEKWKLLNGLRDSAFQESIDEFRKWVIQNGGSNEINNFIYPFCCVASPHANIYMYPSELDYTEFRPNPPNFYRFDTFVRSSANEEKLVIPETLFQLPGKLIYLSMGTIGCSDINLMRKLIGMLAKSPNKFIVSKGPLADQLDLPPNMWGEPTLPQLQIIPIVDLVITHGGNNTLTESFYFGTKIMVLPIFVDQLDNGTRVYETGLGYNFPAHHVTEQEFLPAIEKTLSDELLGNRIKAISKRIQGSDSPKRAADLIEKVAQDNLGKTRVFWQNYKVE